MPRRLPLFLSVLFVLFLFHLTPVLTSAADEFDSEAPSSKPAYPRSITLQKWPLNANAPTPLGQIGYNPKTKKGSYFAVDRSRKEIEGLVRVGMQTETGGWIGTVVDGKALNPTDHNPIVTIRIDSTSGKAYHIEFSTTESKSIPPQVIVLSNAPAGPTPHLNKPIVVGPDGKIPVTPAEKTFLQKYWWLLLGGAILLMSGGGGAE
ncbi:hypothetical protein BDZ91DRAFT_714093 [Kalaharituber pfeilii]|nr:hypothetical protein BDZ91DRAFT_714093 [Kalaharituber pfeilii]